MKIEINNFQSIDHCKLDLPEKAFTCLVGPTNIGKSAIRRALECVLYNKGDANYIRTGAKECTVSLTLEDGTHIKWIRDKKTASYEINGESYSKLSGSVPDILVDKGFKELTLSKEKISVQIAHQFENIFLLNQTGSKITEVLSNLGNLNRIIEANKHCVNDRKNIRSRLKIRQEDNELEKQKINSFLGLDGQKDIVSELKKTLKNIQNKIELKNKIIKINEKYERSYRIFKNLKEVNNVNFVENNIDVDKFKKIKYLYSKFNISSKKIEYFKDINSLNEVSLDLFNDYDKFKKAKKIYNLIYDKKNKINNLSKIPEIIDDININVDNYNNIKKLYNKIIFTKKSILECRGKIENSEKELLILSEEVLNIKKEMKTCPLCDSSLI